MTLLVTVFAAVISTAVWYSSEKARSLRVSSLMFMYWGAALMWLVDAVFEYTELRAEFFTPVPSEMLNDLFLGFAAVAFGLVIWTVILLIKDPDGVLKSVLIKK